MTKLPAGLSYEDKLEHIIEQIVLNVTAPDNASADDIRASIREFSKTMLRLNELEPASDSLIDEIAAEMIDWHAPRPDEEGWNPELADAPAAQRLMAWNKYRADMRAQEREQEWQEREAERKQEAQQEKFRRHREDAERRRARGDHEGRRRRRQSDNDQQRVDAAVRRRRSHERSRGHEQARCRHHVLPQSRARPRWHGDFGGPWLPLHRARRPRRYRR